MPPPEGSVDVQALVERRWGSIEDLPVALQQAICNVASDWLAFADKSLTERFPTYGHDDPLDDLAAMEERLGKLKHKMEAIDAATKALRDPTLPPKLYDYMVRITLDSIVYDIRNAHRKPEFIRRFERFFKRHRP